MVEKRVGAGGCDPTIGNGTDRGRGRAGLKIADPCSPWRLTENHRARWASDLGEAEWTEPSKQATDYTRPSRPGPLLQRMLSPRAHSESPSWEGSRAGGQSLELRPGVWPQFPSPSRLTATPLVGENPVTCPMGLPPGLGHPPALPGGRQPAFCSLVPLSPILSPARTGPKEGFQRDFSMGWQTNILPAGRLPAWPGEAAGGWGPRCSGNGGDRGRFSKPSDRAAWSDTGARQRRGGSVSETNIGGINPSWLRHGASPRLANPRLLLPAGVKGT